MRAFIPRDVFCNDGDLILRLEEKQSGLKTRYACSKTQKMGQYGCVWKHRKTAVNVENYPRTTMCLCFGRGFGMCGILELLVSKITAVAKLKAIGETDRL